MNSTSRSPIPPEEESIRILQALTILTDDRLVYVYEQPEDRNPNHDAELGLVMAYEFPYQTSWKRVFQRLGWEDTEPNRRRLWAAVVAGNQCVIQVRNPGIIRPIPDTHNTWSRNSFPLSATTGCSKSNSRCESTCSSSCFRTPSPYGATGTGKASQSSRNKGVTFNSFNTMSQDTTPAVTKARRSMAKGIQKQGHFAHCPFFEIVPSRAVNVPEREIRNKKKDKTPPTGPPVPDKPPTLDPPDRKIEHTGGHGKRVYTISGSVPGTLSFDDASVVMVLLSLTAPDHRRLTFEHGDITRRTLLDDISPSGTETLGTNTNYHELLNKLGWTINTTRSYERLECSIKRLSPLVRFIYTFSGQSWTSSLIGFRRENKKTRTKS